MQRLFRTLTRSLPEPGPATDPPAGSPDAVARLIVGLGNPGSEHAHNRHNVGFWCLNRLARRAGGAFTRGGGLASIADGRIGGQPIVLAKPRTFVNESGKAVRELVRRQHLGAENVVVICDDLDLPVGVLRIRERGGHGGQNGLRSIIAALGSEAFVRIRIGIGRPLAHGEPTRDPEYVAAYVLADPPAGERRVLEQAVERAADAAEMMIAEGLNVAMNRYNAARDS